MYDINPWYDCIFYIINFEHFLRMNDLFVTESNFTVVAESAPTPPPPIIMSQRWSGVSIQSFLGAVGPAIQLFKVLLGHHPKFALYVYSYIACLLSYDIL